jgi:hypothetical protein
MNTICIWSMRPNKPYEVLALAHKQAIKAHMRPTYFL